MKISDINIRIVKDSRNKDTLEAVLRSGDFEASASVPAGKSKGKFETTTLEPSLVLSKFETIKNQILNKDFPTVWEFDGFLISTDGTKEKSNLGGNLILVLSIAFTKLLAKSENLQCFQLISKILGKTPRKFPYLYFNLIGGGLHAKDSLPFQEYILVTKFPSPAKGLEYAKNCFEKLQEDIEKNFGEVRLGDEGALTIKSDDPRVGLQVLNRNATGPEVSLALDVAASTFFENRIYNLRGKIKSSDDLLSYYNLLATSYPLLSIEDPFSEDDKDGFIKIVANLGEKIWIIADDLTVTNPDLINKAQKEKAATGVIIKPNQIGSVTETLEAIKLAQSYNWKVIISHRSGETMDSFIADLAYGVEADGLKSGAPTQEVRLAKYNRLIEIERNF
ncbi:MAG: Enolase [uncultured bacterium]|uniref:Enolase n=1 Tax=Candidatus Daviesbacteria bacterium GW2011_GWC2_40_12 TaxID=1618431 RepID=A0A0G0TWV5_9BACT|nr:MAG: Enolase [uncultured bacterium]KKR16756.1 MAG: Enolase [Candidatus Daviesbacteria bacterium GW2011_GWA2_39_33]KKR42462.1 MAG: Enolase [Candidatus Daviesbacteria bacterium GW2011_GWC2_40_12]OGE22376.1 MAG: hypothetical protein A2778_00845 [Candidatus Daviesbacteria bacterium RIFCSPHIGHO2_01_FULL_40_24]OGE28463.1 MAG: hypothetical protein A3C29_05840 [Candidatus Daviesbacteria bacterium RIFCSPHIGHO2_02_FULL_40_16]OGE42094.1 MAG: hypothetical protein A3A53_04345 [Candidatus Daviesbacteria 